MTGTPVATRDDAPRSLAAPGAADPVAQPPVALYVHVPFCISRCPYCDFVVYPGAAARGPRARMEPFLAALSVELELRADGLDSRFPARPPLGSVYLGGGTPSLLAPRAVAALLERVSDRFGLEPDAEVTLEANPGADERGHLAGFRAAGVDRVSLGAQSLDAAELRGIGRRHGPTDVLDAVSEARRARFRSVSVDLLYDLPGQTPGRWSSTLDAVLDAGVDHVSAYALTLDDPDAEGLTAVSGDHLPTPPGARRWRQRARAAQDADRAADLYLLADERLAGAGLGWYELSNWARPGHESRHNLAYWRRHPYEALGPGAHASDGGRVRRWTAARLDRYLDALRPPDGSPASLPPGGEESLDDATILAERAMLGLRTREGIGPEVAGERAVALALAWGRGEGLIEDVGGGRVRLSPRGRLLSNAVFVRLL